jgi:uncharacterized coiled-coil protein SlyX
MDVYRITIRLDPALHARLEARGSHGQPLAAIVRQALEHYLVQQPEQPPTVEGITATLAAMTARLDALQDQVHHLTERLEAVAAMRQSPAAREQPQQPEQLRQPAPSAIPAYDTSKFVLGKLCPRGHDYLNTGQSLLRRANLGCLACDREKARERRLAKRNRTS